MEIVELLPKTGRVVTYRACFQITSEDGLKSIVSVDMPDYFMPAAAAIKAMKDVALDPKEHPE
ncbi:hypothetical protein, partial [Bacillus subtilis]|uniref:hypothetical protein n=1 Tax=Bacillus subtilis TaxID=1423 RepID=UPI003C156ABE